MSHNTKYKTALITGAARRIGRSVALALAADEMNLILHYNSSESEITDLAHEVVKMGRRAWAFKADLADPDQAETLFTRARQESGSAVEVLINNASIFPANRLMDFTLADLDKNIRVNAFSPLVLCRMLARQEMNGAIVSFLDTRINDYDAEHAAYHLSKRMLYSMTRMLALELAPQIRVNAVAPGLILPPAGEDKTYLERRKHTNPLGSYGDVSQITDTVLFLLANDFVTGQIIFVDGGRHLKGSVYC